MDAQPVLLYNEEENLDNQIELIRGILECRGGESGKEELSLSNIRKIVNFIKNMRKEYFEVVLTGEPLLHSDFFGILTLLKKGGCTNITLITSDGLFEKDQISKITKDFSHFSFVFSLNSTYRTIADRGKSPGTYDRVLEFVKNVSDARLHNVSCMLKMTVINEQAILEMQEMATMAHTLGCRGVIFSTVMPNNLGKNYVDFYRGWLAEVCRLQNKYTPKVLHILTPDPLARIILPNRNFSCPAGKRSFTVTPEGRIIFCSSLRTKIMDMEELSLKKYQESEVIKGFLTVRNKKCEKCDKNNVCNGGCPARAHIFKKSYDPLCPY